MQLEPISKAYDTNLDPLNNEDLKKQRPSPISLPSKLKMKSSSALFFSPSFLFLPSRLGAMRGETLCAHVSGLLLSEQGIEESHAGLVNYGELLPALVDHENE